MNAYELANYVADNGYIGTSTTHEVANMLRQQADRIAELEKLTREPTKVFAVPDLMAKAGFFKRGERVASQIQTKPLSDDEIWNWFKENTALTKESALRIARAIEERHGIK